MKEITPDKLFWLVKSDKDFLGFFRFSGGAAYIVGGPTGSHFTGEGEGWKLKLGTYIAEGYILENEAKQKQIIKPDWTPPAIEAKDNAVFEQFNERNVFLNSLAKVILFLEKKEENTWRKKLTEIYKWVQKSDENEQISNALNELKGLFGGMGSFNDLYFENDNNKEFSVLQKRLFDSLINYIVVIR